MKRNQQRVQAILSDPVLAARIRLELADRFFMEQDHNDLKIVADCERWHRLDVVFSTSIDSPLHHDNRCESHRLNTHPGV